MEVKPVLTRKVSPLKFYQGSSLLSAPEKANAVPWPLNGCHTAGINASDTKLITPTEIAHTVCPRNNGAGIQKNPFRILPDVDRHQIIRFSKQDEASTLILPDRGWIDTLNHCLLNS